MEKFKIYFDSRQLFDEFNGKMVNLLFCQMYLNHPVSMLLHFIKIKLDDHKQKKKHIAREKCYAKEIA